MLLGWPEAEITGITTVADPGGRRAAYVAHLLHLVGRDDIPLAAGAEVSATTLGRADPVDDERHWPASVTPRPAPPGAALDLLERSLDTGATLVAIGPYTNLALLEISRIGSLRRQPVVVMGGWVDPPAPGLPRWGPEMDFNVQWDTRAAEVVAATARLTMVTLPATLNRTSSPRRPAPPAGRWTTRTVACAAERGARRDVSDGKARARPLGFAGRPAELSVRSRGLRRGSRLVGSDGRGYPSATSAHGRRVVLPAPSRRSLDSGRSRRRWCCVP